MSPEIPRDVADEAGVPADLDSSRVGSFEFPSPRRRRKAARVYVVGAVTAAAGAAAGLPRGLWVVAAGLVAVALHHWITGWQLVVGEGRALEAANRAVPFAVGHASAQVSFVGWRSRPVWDVLVFSADEPPSERGLARIDAVTGELLEVYTEAIRTT